MTDGVFCLVGSFLGTVMAMFYFFAQLEETFDDEEDYDLD